MSSPAASTALLRRQLKEMQQDHGNPNISAGLVGDNIYKWQAMLIIPEDFKYWGGGFFNVIMEFPVDYPINPPKLTFDPPVWHPNIYSNGVVCISILHPPGEDEFEYEKASERWLPIHTPESILLSVMSLFEYPNWESPANMDCALQWKNNPKEFQERVLAQVRQSTGE